MSAELRLSLEYSSDEASPRAARDGGRSAPSPTARADAPLSPFPRGDGASPAAALDLSADGNGDAPLAEGGDAFLSPAPGLDVAPVPPRQCLWCRRPIEQTQLLWCSKKCRQTAWRARKIAVAEDLADTPKRLGFADPAYPGLSRKYYRYEPTYAGEVDHVELVARLRSTYDGWALCTSAKALRDVLPLCPPDARVCAWVKPDGVSSLTRGLHNKWEPVIVVPARFRRPGFRDWLSAKAARGGGTLMGRKPLKFCLWLLQLLGASPVDTLDDLYPGTGIVTRVFRQFQERARREVVRV